jgi:hypothetical protein
MPFQSINSTDQDLQLIQDNISKVIQPLENMPMVNGVVLTSVSLTSGQDNLIRHGLNRAPQYFIILMTKTNSTYWSPTTSSLNNSNVDRTYINLRCSTTSTVTVWVN